MASKAYVVAMTVSELKEELKQRGLSTKGSKRDLRDRLEQALYDEELDDPSSDSESDGEGPSYSIGLGGGGFNFEVPPESFIAEEDIIPDVEEMECEPMIVSVELSNKERLEVCPRLMATTKMDVGVGGRSIDRSLSPMVAPTIVEIDSGVNRQGDNPGVNLSMCSTESKLARAQVPERAKDNLPLSMQIQPRESAESVIATSVSINGGRMQSEARMPSSVGGAGGVVSLPQDHAGGGEVMHVTADQFSSVTELLIADSVSSSSESVARDGCAAKSSDDGGGVATTTTQVQRQMNKLVVCNDVSQHTSLEPQQAGQCGGSSGQPYGDRGSVQDATPAVSSHEAKSESVSVRSEQRAEPGVESSLEAKSEMDSSQSSQKIEESHGDTESEMDSSRSEQKAEQEVEPCRPRHQSEAEMEAKVEAGQPERELEQAQSGQPRQEVKGEEGMDQSTLETKTDAESCELKQEAGLGQEAEPEAMSGQPEGQTMKPEVVSGQPEVVSGQETAPEVVSGQETVPEVVSGQETVPEVVSGQETVPEVVSGQETVLEVVSGQETAPEVVSGQETVPEMVSGQATVPEVVSGQETVPEAVSGQVSGQMEHEGDKDLPQPEEKNGDSNKSGQHEETESGQPGDIVCPDEGQPGDTVCPGEGRPGDTVCPEAKKAAQLDVSDNIAIEERLGETEDMESEATCSNLDQDNSIVLSVAPPPCSTPMEQPSAVSPPSYSAPLEQAVSPCPTPSQQPGGDQETTAEQPSPPATEVKGQSEPDGALPIDKSSVAVTFRPTEFQSPRRSPCPPSSGSLVFLEDLSNPTHLLQSPAPSLDDTSSLRVEPPSPRSETSTMDMTSFMIETTPVDGQATPHELVSSADSGIPQYPGGGMEPDPTHPPCKDAQGEERIGSEISSELSSLPPPIDDDDTTEEPDQQKLSGDVEMSSAEKATIGNNERGVAQSKGGSRRTSVRDDESSCPPVTITLSQAGREEGEGGKEEIVAPVGGGDGVGVEERGVAMHAEKGGSVETMECEGSGVEDVAGSDQHQDIVQDATSHQDTVSSAQDSIDEGLPPHDVKPSSEDGATQFEDTIPPVQDTVEDDLQSQDALPPPKEDSPLQDTIVPKEESRNIVQKSQDNPKDDQDTSSTQQDSTASVLQDQAMHNTSPPNPKVSGATPTATPTGLVPEEVSAEAVDSGQIEVDLLVHAEAEDLSVFSSEAAEADELQALSSSGQRRKGGSSNKLSNKAVGTTGSLAGGGRRGSQSSRGNSPSVVGGGGSSSSRRSPPPPTASGAREKRNREDKQEVHTEPPSIKRRRVSANILSGSASAEGGVAGAEPRKRKWGSGRQRSNSGSTTTISTDVLKDIIPAGVDLEDMEGVVTVEVDQEGMEGVVEDSKKTPPTEEKKDAGKEPLSAVEQEWEEIEREREVRRREAERARQEVETRKRIEARFKAKQEAAGRARKESTENAKNRVVSPPRHAPCKLVHVNNLTRPYTRGQLFEILTEDGPIVQELFWTNKVKSHCIALYETTEAAIATRSRLHGTKWPSVNPKLLAVDFLSAEDALRLTEGELVIREEALHAEETKEVEKVDAMEEETKKEEKEGEEDVFKESKEVDVVAVVPRPPSQQQQQQRKERPPSQSSKEEKPAEEEKRAGPEVATPTTVTTPKKEATKLLDELFRKTKAIPCIYWLPLSETQVASRVAKEQTREAEREQRREERMQQRKEELRSREREQRERQERLDAERERRARARLRQRSRSRSRSRSKDRKRKR